MANVSQWSTTAASNNSASPDGAPEGMAPSGVNDTIREIMAALAKWYSDADGTLTTAGSGNAYTLTTNSVHAALADMPLVVFRADRANTGAATLNVDSLGAKSMTLNGSALESGNIRANQIVAAVYNSSADTYEVINVQGGVSAGDLAGSTNGFAFVNGTLSASVNASALTISIKTLGGADPSASDPVYIIFRNATAATGNYVVRTINSANSITVTSGATLGASNSTAFRIWITAHDDGGTVRLGVSNRKTATGISAYDEAAQVSTTLMSAAADSAGTIYTGSAVTSKPLTVLGYAEYSSGLSTAGTYNIVPPILHLRTQSTKMPGDIVQTHQTHKSDTTTTTSTTYADISGMSVAIPVTSAPNSVMVSASLSLGGTISVNTGINLVRGSTTIGEGDSASSRTQSIVSHSPESVDGLSSVGFNYIDNPGAAGSTTYKLQWLTESGTIYLNRGVTDTDAANFHRASSNITAIEIMS